jgi:hypothetical protein
VCCLKNADIAVGRQQQQQQQQHESERLRFKLRKPHLLAGIIAESALSAKIALREQRWDTLIYKCVVEQMVQVMTS